MSAIEDRLNAVNARLEARMAALENRIAARFGGTPQTQQGGVAPNAGTGTGTGTRYGLFFGIGEYDPSVWGMKPGPHFVDNVENLRDACVRFGGWSPENVKLVTNGQATVEGIGRHMAALAGRAVSGDVVLVCFSTHGGRDRGPSDNDSSLAAYDGRYMEAELRRNLLSFRKGVRLVVILQSCHSAAMFERSLDSCPAFSGEDFESFREAAARESRPGDGFISEGEIGWIASAAADQTSISAPGGSFVLTHTLIREGWLAGCADGFSAAVRACNDPSALESSDALLRVEKIGLPLRTGCVSFLDLAAYSTWKWKDVYHQFTNGNGTPAGSPRHVPCFANAAVLDSLVAGKTASATERGCPGADIASDGFAVRSGRSATRYGLFAGVNHSPCGNVLSGCINDANDLRKACVELGGWHSGNATVLEDAGGEEFLQSLAVLAKCAKPGDEVLVSFSGHGVCDGGRPDDDFMFAFSDGPLPEGRVRRALSAFNRAVRIVFVVDACNSDAAALAGPAESSLPSNVGWIVASTSWQNSSDNFQGRKNGFLTGALLDGWCKGGAIGMASQIRNSAEGSPALRLAVDGNPPTGSDSVTFLDLAVFVAHSWRYWHPKSQQPQYHNPSLLQAFVAGRTGV